MKKAVIWYPIFQCFPLKSSKDHFPSLPLGVVANGGKNIHPSWSSDVDKKNVIYL